MKQEGKSPIAHSPPPPQGFGRSSRFASLSRPAGAPLPRRPPCEGREAVSGTIPFQGAAGCKISETIPHKEATTTRNSPTGSLPRSRQESHRGADLGTRTL